MTCTSHTEDWARKLSRYGYWHLVTLLHDRSAVQCTDDARVCVSQDYVCDWVISGAACPYPSHPQILWSRRQHIKSCINHTPHVYYIMKVHRLFAHHRSTLIAGIVLICWLRFVYSQTNFWLWVWNFGKSTARVMLSADVIFWLLFAFLIKLQLYKASLFSAWNSTRRKWLFGIIWWGCPMCSITLSSMIWLGGILSRLPFGWYELKVLWLLVVSYSVYDLRRNLEVCKK